MTLMSFTLKAQPESTPACNNPNPPWWCDQNPVPIDNHLWILIATAILFGSFIYYKSTKSNELSKDKG